MKHLRIDQKGIVSDAGVYTTKEEKMFLKNAIQLKGGKNAFILGIETSCDDTACAIVTKSGHVVSEAIKSQVSIHENWGGVGTNFSERSAPKCHR